MSSSGLTMPNFRIMINKINNNNQRIKHLTAITYSQCYAPFFNQEIWKIGQEIKTAFTRL